MKDAPLPISSVLPPLPNGWWAQSYKVLAGGRLAVVGADADLWAAWKADRELRTVNQTARLAAQATAKVWTVQGEGLIEEVQFALLDAFPMIDQFPDGRWLAAHARSRGERNGRVLSRDGDELRRVQLGDGINHIKIDDRQRIWVGWFDEGVFGNDHWRVPGLKYAPSAYGIAAFDDHGTLVAHASLPSIADCYALNAFGREVWSCTYTEFPLWRMTDQAESTWQTSLTGVSAIAVNFPHVVAVGGYGGDRDRVVLLKLEGASARKVDEWRMPLLARDSLSRIDGRGDEVHAVCDGRWHRWRVRDFVKA
ncbi:MAG: hypothetical protein ABUS57_06755 [Pseudomonadota bacterium]